jgi:hypothetical protein
MSLCHYEVVLKIASTIQAYSLGTNYFLSFPFRFFLFPSALNCSQASRGVVLTPALRINVDRPFPGRKDPY